jgi:hypothetical protein
MKYIPILLTVLLLACGQNTTEKKTTTDTLPAQPSRVDTATRSSLPTSAIYDDYLPSRLVAYVRRSLPDWKLPDPSAWEKYWFDQYTKDKSLVNFISGDFNCDGATDHALVLLHQKGDIGAWAFLARDSSFEKTKLDQFEHLSSGLIEIGLELLEKGEHGHLGEDGEMAKPAIVKCEGVTVIFFEKAARSYYWEKGKLKAIQTGD